MTDELTPMAKFVSTLLSRGLGGQEVAEIVALAEAAFAGPTSRSGSDAARRERERLKKQRHRARKSAAVPVDVHGTPENRSYTVSSNRSDSSKEESKSALEVSPGTKVDKPKRDRGHTLPVDWAPKPSHYDKGATLGFDRGRVDFFAERMRNWAGANAHRPVARKSNWDLAFHNWLSDKTEKTGGSPHGKIETHDAVGGLSGLGARLRRAIADEQLELDAAGGQEPPHRR